MSSFQVLVDSDAFVGRFYPRDAHYQQAVNLFAKLQQQRMFSVTTSMVIDEVATVLSHRQGQDSSRLFLKTIEETKFPVIFVDEPLRRAGLAVFVSQNKKGMSVTDCCNVVVMRKLAIPQILAFDQVYSKTFKLDVFQE